MSLKKIQRYGGFFKKLFTLFFFVPLAASGLGWAFMDDIAASGWLCQIEPAGAGLPILGEITPKIKILGFLAALIPVGLKMAAFWYLIRLFGLYERGEIFTRANVGCIRRIGWVLLIGQIVAPLDRALTGVILTLNNPPGARMLRLGLDGNDVSTAVIAGVIILASWIMDLGRELQEENALTV